MAYQIVFRWSMSSMNLQRTPELTLTCCNATYGFGDALPYNPDSCCYTFRSLEVFSEASGLSMRCAVGTKGTPFRPVESRCQDMPRLSKNASRTS